MRLKEIKREQESITSLNEKGTKTLQSVAAIAKLNESMTTARK